MKTRDRFSVGYRAGVGLGLGIALGLGFGFGLGLGFVPMFTYNVTFCSGCT